MIYIIKMPTRLVPGTSLFVTIFVSVIVTFLHSFNYGSIDLMLVVMLVIGSIIGVQLGQKLGEKIDSSGLRALLAILLLVVGIAIAYDTFFAEQAQTEISSISNSDLNFFSKFIKEFSNDMPFFYGLFSILIISSKTCSAKKVSYAIAIPTIKSKTASKAFKPELSILSPSF